MTIEDYLLGHWSNKFQAQSSPHLYSSVESKWERVEGGLYSKNYFRRTPNDPYRERYHKIVSLSDTMVRVENYTLDWTRSENCDMIFVFDGTAWHGELETPGLCMGVKGYRVVSEIHLLGDKLHSRDQGYNDRDEMVWGSELLYKFIRLGD